MVRGCLLVGVQPGRYAPLYEKLSIIVFDVGESVLFLYEDSQLILVIKETFVKRSQYFFCATNFHTNFGD